MDKYDRETGLTNPDALTLAEIEFQEMFKTYDYTKIIDKDKYNNNIEKKSYLTDWGKGIFFKANDGTEWATMKDAIAHNQELNESLRDRVESRENNGRSRTR